MFRWKIDQFIAVFGKPVLIKGTFALALFMAKIGEDDSLFPYQAGICSKYHIWMPGLRSMEFYPRADLLNQRLIQGAPLRLRLLLHCAAAAAHPRIYFIEDAVI